MTSGFKSISQRNIFFIRYDMNSDFTSNKPTHYLFENGEFVLFGGSVTFLAISSTKRLEEIRHGNWSYEALPMLSERDPLVAWWPEKIKILVVEDYLLRISSAPLRCNSQLFNTRVMGLIFGDLFYINIPTSHEAFWLWSLILFFGP